MTTVTLYEGDNRDNLRRLIDQGVRVHSVVTDPPYGLSFMGKHWDGSMIERDPEFWKLILEILLPGGYCFAFSGSRTGHWQACAMEMAGFIMHPMHGWVYGSGFPKAVSASKAIDNYLGIEGSKGEASIKWNGWGYGTQAQKPALEPIFLGQKPMSEKTGAANILKHGVGAVNIDGCRVPTDEVITNHSRGAESAVSKEKYGDSKAQETHQTEGQKLGRHPSNLILDGSPEVVALFPETKSGKPGIIRQGENRGAAYGAESRPSGTAMTGFGDSGSAARFFHQFPLDTDPLIYQAKASKQDRAGSKHPTVKPVALMQYLVRHITPPGGTVLDPFAGSGTTAEAARREGFDCILMEREPEYVEFLRERFPQETDELMDLLA